MRFSGRELSRSFYVARVMATVPQGETVILDGRSALGSLKRVQRCLPGAVLKYSTRHGHALGTWPSDK